MANKNRSKEADGFKSRWGFILAAMGSAIGLGNIWRYPVVAYGNGGGSFLIPYLVALATAAIPLLILEFNIGNKYRGSAPAVFRKIHPKLEFIGWLQTFIGAAVPMFYSVVIAWLMYYFYKAFTLGWGEDTTSAFNNEFLQISDVPSSFFALGGVNIKIVILVTVVWLITGAILLKGIAEGIEKVNKVMVPTLLLMFALVVIYSLTLDGAVDGLQQFFAPQWDKIGDTKIWLAAYGQVFFSTSIAAGIMITYSSYTPKDADLNSNALITGLGNASVELAAGFGVFAALGFLAMQQGVNVDQVVKGGPGLVFTIYPSILNQLPGAVGIVVGVVFYISLLFAGFSSLISLVEVVIASLSEKFSINRKKAVVSICIVLYLLSILIATPAGLYLLDIIDNFLNTYIWQLSGAMEIFGVIIIAIVSKQLYTILGHGNEHSVVKVNPVLLAVILMITGLLLTYFLIDGFIIDINPKTLYGDYPSYMINVWGWGTVIVGIVFALVLSILPNKKVNVEEDE